VPVAAYVLAFSVLAAIAIATARETAHVPMAQLDQRQAVTAARLVTTQRRPARASGPSRQNVPNRS
jgi:hypothetical protein